MKGYKMFVSSYNIYTPPKHTNKAQESATYTKEDRNDYKSSFSQEMQKAAASSKQLPINYISNYKALNNQQLLQQQSQLTQEYSKTKFSKINKINNAQKAYSENTTSFSFIQKPKIALTQEIRQLKHIVPTPALKQKFISTYIANDNYYKVTAA